MSTSRMDLRLGSTDKELIERGASIAGFKSTSEFVLVTMKIEAQKVIESSLDTTVSQERFDSFMAACNNAPEPNAALTEAFKAAKEAGFE